MLQKVRSLLGIIPLLLLPLIGFSQTTEKDSLVGLLSNTKNEEKLKILFQLSDLTSDSEEGVKYANDAISLAKKINENALADAYDNLGLVYYNQMQDVCGDCWTVDVIAHIFNFAKPYFPQTRSQWLDELLVGESD